MLDIKITDVRMLPGDSAFLIDNGDTSILYDSGFAFTGNAIAKNIQNVLGERKLDYIFLTHSHYDHVLGSVYIKKLYPDAKVVASDYVSNIFKRDSARSVMRDLDKKFASTSGIENYEDLIDELTVDITVADESIFMAGSMNFEVIYLPGHTRCSVGYYCREKKLMLGTETTGIYNGNGLVIPSYLVGYNMALESILKMKKYDIRYLLVPHYGIICDNETKIYLENAYDSAIQTATEINHILKSGGSKEDAIEFFKNKFYHGCIKSIYPIDALNLNTEIMVNMIEKEFR